MSRPYTMQDVEREMKKRDPRRWARVFNIDAPCECMLCQCGAYCADEMARLASSEVSHD